MITSETRLTDAPASLWIAPFYIWPYTGTMVDTAHAMVAVVTGILTLVPKVARATGTLASHRVTRAIVITVTFFGAVFTKHPKWTGQGALLPFPTCRKIIIIQSESHCAASLKEQ